MILARRVRRGARVAFARLVHGLVHPGLTDFRAAWGRSLGRDRGGRERRERFRRRAAIERLPGRRALRLDPLRTASAATPPAPAATSTPAAAASRVVRGFRSARSRGRRRAGWKLRFEA